MKISAAFPSQYLKGTDLQGKTVRVRIDKVVVETVGQGRDAEDKPILYFIDKEKGMVMNKTNMKEIVHALGDVDLPCAEWHGNTIELFHDPNVMYGSERKGGLRLRVPANGQAAPQRAAPARPVIHEVPPFADEPGSHDHVDDDSIPF